jgi:hypothetical protein
MFVQAKFEHTTSDKDGGTAYYTNIVTQRIDFVQSKDAGRRRRPPSHWGR